MKRIKAENWKLAVGDEIDVIIRSNLTDSVYSAYRAIISDIVIDDSQGYFVRADIYFKYVDDVNFAHKVRAVWTYKDGVCNSLTDQVYYNDIHDLSNLSMSYIILPKGLAADYIIQQIKLSKVFRRQSLRNSWKYKLFPKRCKFRDKNQII